MAGTVPIDMVGANGERVAVQGTTHVHLTLLAVLPNLAAAALAMASSAFQSKKRLNVRVLSLVTGRVLGEMPFYLGRECVPLLKKQFVEEPPRVHLQGAAHLQSCSESLLINEQRILKINRDAVYQ